MAKPRSSPRPVDLARLAGISTQQVRNYIDTAILPPAGRTAAGYRRLHDGHRKALLAYRALAHGHGADVARRIMQAVHAGDVPGALAILDASHAGLHEQRLAVQETGQALEAVAEQPPESTSLPRTGRRIGDVAGYLRVRPSALRVWEAAGLLRPEREPGTGYRRYRATDVRDARMVKMLRDGRYPLPQIHTIVDGLRRTGSSDALRAALARRRVELTQRSTVMLAAAGLLHEYLRSCDGLPSDGLAPAGPDPA
jgi:DNA-binding transcriptional MerR regulator